MPQPSKETGFDPPYDELFKGVLAFSTFAEAEQTLGKLENLRHLFLAASDKKGVECCRKIAALGRRRAELISRNTRVSPEKRMHKREVARWFQIWLETPEIFGDWLALRQKSPEFLVLKRSERLK